MVNNQMNKLLNFEKQYCNIFRNDPLKKERNLHVQGKPGVKSITTIHTICSGGCL